MSSENTQQAELWNGPGGETWVRAQALLDAAFLPFESLLADAATSAGARVVLDVGCGTGATTLAIARRLAPGARCVGVDISKQMSARAESRAAEEASPASFICADAQTYAFAPARFDMIVSRFGVMFFADPVAAFANLRRAAVPGGTLAMISWRAAVENPFMTAAERAVRHLLPALPPRDPNTPGQFAFADRAHVHGILDDAGWSGIESEALDISCAFPAAALDTYVSLMGPVGRALATVADEGLREQITDAVRNALEDYRSGAEIRFETASWLTRATA